MTKNNTNKNQVEVEELDTRYKNGKQDSYDSYAINNYDRCYCSTRRICVHGDTTSTQKYFCDILVAVWPKVEVPRVWKNAIIDVLYEEEGPGREKYPLTNT